MKLTIISKWHKSFGLSKNEIPQNESFNYIKYMENKNIIIYSYTGNLIEFISLYDEIKKMSNTSIYLKITTEYTFLNRDFCNINYNFENFIKKCKRYYSQKLSYYKSPKTIVSRQNNTLYKFKYVL
tara:strand:+ start:6818 stop:7195 length:378 start_codon:yes stop_codon:yes gene_type:complete